MAISNPGANNAWTTQGAQILDAINGTGGRVEITDQINSRICPIVGKNIRTTDSPIITPTRARIISFRFPCRNGRTYGIYCSGEVAVAPGGGVGTCQNEIRASTNDTEPTTSSAQFGRGLVTPDSGGIPTPVMFGVLIDCNFDGFIRPAVVSFRAAGAANSLWVAASDRPMCFWAVDHGPTVANSGTVYT